MLPLFRLHSRSSRVALTRLIVAADPQNGCTGGWGLCLTNNGARIDGLGAYFTDLPSNMLGSFIMGLLANSGHLQLAVQKVTLACSFQ